MIFVPLWINIFMVYEYDFLIFCQLIGYGIKDKVINNVIPRTKRAGQLSVESKHMTTSISTKYLVNLF